MSKGNKLGGLAGVASSVSGGSPPGHGLGVEEDSGLGLALALPSGAPSTEGEAGAARRQTGMLGSLRTVTAGRAGRGGRTEEEPGR